MDLRGWRRAPAAALALLLVSASAAGAQTCTITGPNSAASGASFSLCGPAVSGFTYQWSGPGLSSNVTSRCVSASGLASGAYEFLLIRSRDGYEVDRCVHVVNVGGSTGGTTSCRISGPTSIASGASATLCPPNDGIHSYRWSGPDGFTSTSPCITVSDAGTYTLNSRNPFTGSSRVCTHRLDVVGAGGGSGEVGSCLISGPDEVTDGGTVRLCAPSRSNTSYRWTGPGGFSATARCITVSATGNYTVDLRNLSTGRIDRCSHAVGLIGEVPADDPDSPYWDNCPRDLAFWRQAFRDNSGSGLTASDLQLIAREVDRRSSYFNWANDVQGMRSALGPAAPLTRRKQIARQYASLLANVSAGELGVGDTGYESISLDPETRISFSGASTVGELVALTDRWLRENRGDFNRLNATLNQLNRGRGIGPVCNTVQGAQ